MLHSIIGARPRTTRCVDWGAGTGRLTRELCDRIVVLCGGQVSGVVDARKTDKREVGALMTLVRGGNKDE